MLQLKSREARDFLRLAELLRRVGLGALHIEVRHPLAEVRCRSSAEGGLPSGTVQRGIPRHAPTESAWQRVPCPGPKSALLLREFGGVNLPASSAYADHTATGSSVH